MATRRPSPLVLASLVLAPGLAAARPAAADSSLAGPMAWAPAGRLPGDEPVLTRVTVRGDVGTAGPATILDFGVPSTVVVRDDADPRGRTVSLLLMGVRVPGAVERPVRAGGVRSVAVRMLGDTATLVSIALTDMRGYELRPAPGGGLRLTLAGTGEQFAPRVVDLTPLPTDVQIVAGGFPGYGAPGSGASAAGYAGAPSPASDGARPRLGWDADAPGRTRGGRELRDDAMLAPEERTSARMAAWDAGAPPTYAATWDRTALADALAGLAAVSGRSIIAGAGTDSVTVSGSFRNARWTDVLRTLVQANHLRLRVGDGDALLVEGVDAVRAYNESVPLEIRTFQLSYVSVETMIRVLERLVTPKRGSVTGIPERRNLLVQDTPEAIARIAQAIRVVDRPDRLIRVSAMVVSVDRATARNLGVQFEGGNRNGGNSLGGISAPGSTTTTTSGSSGSTTGSTTTSGFAINQNQTSGAFASVPAVAGSVGQLLYTVVNGRLSLTALVQALESSSRTRVVARQMGFVREGETFSGVSGERTPLRTVGFGGTQGGGVTSAVGSTAGGGSTVSNGSNSTASYGGLPAVGLLETGTKLLVTPRPEPDDQIALDVRIERSAAVPSSLGDLGVQFTVNTYESRFRAANGATTVLGGLEDRTQDERESRVPGLGALPLVGGLFRSKGRSASDHVLLVLVTASIEN